MAIELAPLVAEVKQPIALEELANKRVAIDAYNTIYQFLSIIRQPDGTPLMDSKGRVTSHLSGLFYRNISLIEKGIVPIYVFDGIPPILKRRTLEARMNRRTEAMAEWQKAKEEGMLEEARTHAMASTRINKEIVQDAKLLLGAMGIPYIQAPSEGEAQAAYLTRENLVYAAGSQDYDLFPFGAKVVVRNITITGKRKLPKKNVFVDVNVERILLDDFLKHYGINREQLVLLSMLVGTDFNEGVEKVGAKTALKVVKDKTTLEEVEKYLKEKYNYEFEVDAREVRDFFLHPEVNSVPSARLEDDIRSSQPSKDAIMKLMCDEHEFAQERIGKFSDKLVMIKGSAGQKGMSEWF